MYCPNYKEERNVGGFSNAPQNVHLRVINYLLKFKQILCSYSKHLLCVIPFCVHCNLVSSHYPFASK